MFDPFTIRKLIEEHGITVTLRKVANGAYNIATGVLAQTDTDYSVKAYFFNNDPSISEYNTVVTGERRVLVSDKLVNGNTTPDIVAGDEIVGFGDTVKVSRSSKITSGSSNMVQLLYVKE